MYLIAILLGEIMNEKKDFYATLIIQYIRFLTFPSKWKELSNLMSNLVLQSTMYYKELDKALKSNLTSFSGCYGIIPVIIDRKSIYIK